jgi:hypothetical protein
LDKANSFGFWLAVAHRHATLWRPFFDALRDCPLGFAQSEGKRASAAMSSSVRNFALRQAFNIIATSGGWVMNGIIYLVGLVVVIGVVLSFLGLR